MSTAPPRFERSPHLVAAIAETERLAAAVAEAPRSAREAQRTVRRDAAVLASLRLDGSYLEAPPSPEVVASARDAVPTPATGGRPGTWFDAMGVGEDLTDEQTAAVAALEYLGVRAATDADDLVEAATTAPVSVLGDLHARLTTGLVSPERAGAPRELDQAVHDASNGRVLFFAVPPERIATKLALLDAWLRSTGTREHALVTTGVLQHELLRIHPFDAANGRLARATARLALRGHGLDPDGLAAPEVALARDPLGYHEEVARTVRRRDLTIWLERWAEAVSDGLRDVARTLGRLPDRPSDAAATVVRALPDAFTVADHRAVSGLDPAGSREQLTELLDAGAVVRVPGARGLRFTRRVTGETADRSDADVR